MNYWPCQCWDTMWYADVVDLEIWRWGRWGSRGLRSHRFEPHSHRPTHDPGVIIVAASTSIPVGCRHFARSGSDHGLVDRRWWWHAHWHRSRVLSLRTIQAGRLCRFRHVCRTEADLGRHRCRFGQRIERREPILVGSHNGRFWRGFRERHRCHGRGKVIHHTCSIPTIFLSVLHLHRHFRRHLHHRRQRICGSVGSICSHVQKAHDIRAVGII
mmetsp:Transcript_17800/g.40855  ORF Transcript_17800/g.40855 Transcript_17800/m.40855 type:complete len:214 (+) Transcript_17800:155-796(+)